MYARTASKDVGLVKQNNTLCNGDGCMEMQCCGYDSTVGCSVHVVIGTGSLVPPRALPDWVNAFVVYSWTMMEPVRDQGTCEQCYDSLFSTVGCGLNLSFFSKSKHDQSENSTVRRDTRNSPHAFDRWIALAFSPGSVTHHKLLGFLTTVLLCVTLARQKHRFARMQPPTVTQIWTTTVNTVVEVCCTPTFHAWKHAARGS